MRYLFVITVFLIANILTSCSGDQSQGEAPTIPVYLVQSQVIPIYREFVGQINGYQDIAIRARVHGFLEQLHFKEGSHVKKGDLLYTIESQPFEADVAAKMSGVAEAKTMLAKAQSDLNRIRPLAEQKAVSESDLDGAVAQYDASVASVEAAQANLRASKIQLSYTRVYAPISGIIGKTKAKVGDFVGQSPNPIILNVVSRIDTILVQFFLTESQYLTLARFVGSADSIMIKQARQSQLQLILADGSVYEHKGRIDFIDREIDPTTGAILVQASFPNPDELIRPGQFGKVKIKVFEKENGIMIPQRCITELQGTYNIFVVNDQNMIEKRTVKVGPKIKSFWVILEGLQDGEKVVYEGIQKVREGLPVNPEILDIKPIDTTTL